MSGILDPSYGVAEERRSRLIKRIALWGVVAVVVGGALFLWFRNWRQEQAVKQFFALLEQKKYQDAYAMWGCTQDHPCKYYSPAAFNEDWGPSSPFADVAAIKIEHEDNCGTGVVFDLESPHAMPTGLYVDKDTGTLSFAPGPRCPGRHLQIMEFLKSHLG
ncbi:MAG TPA: hypothetical protein VMG40_19685 [Bryobacteraceae bacterium]|nr:hypothetical protein [Bryobacteraceae bacterium]